ncbi:unnamed protein product [Rotaria magnacalcarata]|uniref:Uncharacterized protein n=1 Tax=Rotaria magnacalcarata TaxID=392030 RepID=A0A820K0Y4_9BILA|nr:unnamed protein product [Rotaria magnacalcarata]CAF4436741.1 unnamed protein product [Rotaria magnacalcarata]
MNENSSQNYVVKYADEVLLGLSCHLNFNVVKSFINVNDPLVNIVLFSARTTGYRQCVVYLLANTRIV